ncbi:MAG: ATP-binding protein [Cyanobacteria bacterium P01_D01_bin.44]
MSLSLFQLTVLAMILGGAAVMMVAIRKTRQILDVLKADVGIGHWHILFGLTVFFLGGYSLAAYLVVAHKFSGFPLLTGIVFFFGALFVWFSVSLYYKTLLRLVVTGKNYRQAQRQAEQALTQLKQAQTQLVHSEKMLGLGRLSAGIAHEINNPIGFIDGNINPLEKYVSDLLSLTTLYAQAMPCPPSEIEDLLEEIDFDFLRSDVGKMLTSMRTGVARIRKITQSMRYFARLDETGWKRISLHDSLDSTVMLLSQHLQVSHEQEESNPDGSRIQVYKQYGELPKIYCDPSTINQVFMNVLINAIDALQKNANAAIMIRTEVVQECLRVAISDNGPGIPEKICDRIFDPFFTTKPVGQGTGLGLSISYQIIVEQHGGNIRCQSVVGQDTEFVIELPLVPRDLAHKTSAGLAKMVSIIGPSK